MWGHGTVAETKPWDSTLKRLLRVDPMAFVKWILPGAIFIKERPYELESEKREVDALLDVVVDGKLMLLHIEFQTYNDSTMAERLLLYNVLVRSVHKLPVLSCVIYLLRDGNIQKSPLRLTVPSGQTVLDFHFVNIEVGQLEPEDILNTNIVALLPLLSLTKGGATREELLKMFRELKMRSDDETETNELELIAYTLAALVLQRENKVDLDWLIRRFREMHDILRESPIYQEILSEGREEGREEGRLEHSRHILVVLTQVRFPSLITLAQRQAAAINDLKVLDDVIVKIGLAQTQEEVQAYLLGWDN